MTHPTSWRSAYALAYALTLALAALAQLQCGAPPWLALRYVDHSAVRGARAQIAEHQLTLPAGRTSLHFEAGDALAFPPIVSTVAMAGGAVSPVPVPLVLMLHGICGTPAGSCRALGAAGRTDSWLVCPSGNATCGGSFDWRGDGEEKATHLDEVIQGVREHWPGLVAEPGSDVLVGFSRGAFVARDVAYARPGRYKGLVLIGASLTPDPRRLLANGVRRVVLASGDFDEARPMMMRAALLLQQGGVEARFVSTGKVWHHLPPNLDALLAPHIAWVRAG